MSNPISAHSPLAWVSLAGCIYAISNGITWFVLPLYASTKFGIDILMVSLLMALPYIGSLLFDLPTGTLSDYVGRKKVIIVGLVLLAPLSLALPYANSLELFIAFGIAFGILSTFVLPVARALIMDLCPPKKAAEYFGIVLGLMTLGSAVGPSVAGTMMGESLEGDLFSVMAISALFSLLAIVPLLFVKETIKAKQSISAGFKKVTKQGFFMPAIREFGALKTMGIMVIYVTLILTIIDSIIWTFEPLMGEEKGLGFDSIGNLLLIFVASLVFFQLLGGFIAERLGKIKVLAVGLVLAGVFMVLFGLQTTEDMLIITALLTSMGLALSWPAVSGVITDISVNQQRGGISGVWTFFMDLAYVVGPMLGGFIWTFSGTVSSIFMVMGALLILSVIPLAVISKK